jgi:hypothetical protein
VWFSLSLGEEKPAQARSLCHWNPHVTGSCRFFKVSYRLFDTGIQDISMCIYRGEFRQLLSAKMASHCLLTFAVAGRMFRVKSVPWVG